MSARNPWLATQRARLVWVHKRWQPFSRAAGECSVMGCDEQGYEVGIGFGPGTAIDETSITLFVSLCDPHAERAAQEACGVRLRRRVEVCARRVLRLS